MPEPTARGLLETVQLAATAQGASVTLAHVKFIVSAYLEGLAHADYPGGPGGVEWMFQTLADQVRDA